MMSEFIVTKYSVEIFENFIIATEYSIEIFENVIIVTECLVAE